jgi:hypothetical protein
VTLEIPFHALGAGGWCWWVLVGSAAAITAAFKQQSQPPPFPVRSGLLQGHGTGPSPNPNPGPSLALALALTWDTGVAQVQDHRFYLASAPLKRPCLNP